ncbi:MAG: hypothetical protein IPO52_15945 [Gemmatimonadetes bacterium]|nr:hypothetical protein [Gemmatimonadota bacterium]
MAVLHGVAQRPMAITLTFGAPVGFDSHGVLLPCIDGATEFHGLRAPSSARQRSGSTRPT